MISRDTWRARVLTALSHHPRVWLHGVRRSGKTTLALSLPGVEYVDCAAPQGALAWTDLTQLLRKSGGAPVVLDEAQRLPDLPYLLEAAAAETPGQRILLVSSALPGAAARLPSSLHRWVTPLHLTPMTGADLMHVPAPGPFARETLLRRLYRGGLPPFFFAPEPSRRNESPHMTAVALAEATARHHGWVDEFWARDVQELHRLERRQSFEWFLMMLFIESGSMFEATRFAPHCGVSRTSVLNYLAALEHLAAVTVVRPFWTTRTQEIVGAPNVYAFDTGFVCAARGWDSADGDRFPELWEHLVLNELVSLLPPGLLHYWRSKAGPRVPFVLPPAGGGAVLRRPMRSAGRAVSLEPVAGTPGGSGDLTAIEVSASLREFDPAGLTHLRSRYPRGRNLLVAADVTRSHDRYIGDLLLRCVGLNGLSAEVASVRGGGLPLT